MAAASQAPHTAVSKHKEITYDTLIALFHFATDVKRRLLKYYLQRKSLNVCDLFKDNRNEMWLFEDFTQAFRKSSVVLPKDLSLNTINYILNFNCNDLFWNSCLNDGQVTFQDFLNEHWSEIYKLTTCSNGDNSSSCLQPDSAILSKSNFELLFNCSRFKDKFSKMSAKEGIELVSLNQDVNDILLKTFCPLKRSFNCLTDDQRTICKTVVLKEAIKKEIWISIESHSAAIAEQYNKKKSELQRVESLRNIYLDEKQILENRKRMLEDALKDASFLQDHGFCDCLRQELQNLSQDENWLMVKRLCSKKISIELPHGQYRYGMYQDAVLNCAEREVECFNSAYGSEGYERFDTIKEKDRHADNANIEKHNYLKLIQLLKDVGRNVFIEILKNRLPGAHYGYSFKGMKERLCPYLNVAERDKLFPDNSVYSGDLTDLDLSLLYIILRNLNTIPPHSKFWGNDPEPTDRSVSANLERIRIAKNYYVSHFPECSISYDIFKNAWEEIRKCIVELGGEKYIEEIDTLFTTAINPLIEIELIEAVKNLKKTEKMKKKEVEKCKEDLNKVKEDLRTLNSKVNRLSSEDEERTTGRTLLTASLRIESRNLPLVEDLKRRVHELNSDNLGVQAIRDGSLIFELVISAKSNKSVGFFIHVLDDLLDRIFSRPEIYMLSSKVIIVSVETDGNIPDKEKIETHNYLKLIQLLKEVGKNVLIDVLKSRLPGAHYGTAFVGMKQRLRPFLNSTEYSTLFPEGSKYSGNLYDLDISLLYIILRNLNTIPSHLRGWGNVPEAMDRSISANLDRMRIAKNYYVSHYPDCSISDDIFKKAWEEIRQCIVELGGDQYNADIDILLITAINPLMERDLIKAVQSLNKYEELKQKDVAKLKEVLNKVKEDVRMLKSRITTEPEDLERSQLKVKTHRKFDLKEPEDSERSQLNIKTHRKLDLKESEDPELSEMKIKTHRQFVFEGAQYAEKG